LIDVGKIIKCEPAMLLMAMFVLVLVLVLVLLRGRDAARDLRAGGDSPCFGLAEDLGRNRN
jgi:hypothetical protein